MDFANYQKKAQRTDQVPEQKDSEDMLFLIIPMLGLVGETGELLSEYKKNLRDGEAHMLFNERVCEELGDLLWYIANVASKFDLTLDEIAIANLNKLEGRWVMDSNKPPYFDSNFPEDERLPRQLLVELGDIKNTYPHRSIILVNGEQFGAELMDNNYLPDGYRFHDVFHFAYAAVLGWSPVTRRLLKRKRKSNSRVDEVEDGGRATVIEEAIAALSFEYAQRHKMLDGVNTLDFQLLRTIKYMTTRLEVSQCTTGEWEKAILLGFKVWRSINDNCGGKISIDMDNQRIDYCKPNGSD